MGQVTLVVTAPHATPYDSDYPTRSTENYSHALHEILQDMEDAGWIIHDHALDATDSNSIAERMHDMIEEVFDYADSAITTYRSTGDPSLSKPTYESVTRPTMRGKWRYALLQMETYRDCMRMMYKIYYMWESAEDPLLLKEKLQELLIAWPLLDTTIELNSELGQEFKIYPSWKNADLDL